MFTQHSRLSFALALVAIALALGLFAWYKSSLFVTREESVQSSNDQDSEVAGWRTYRNEQYGFEFKYPRDWIDKGTHIDIPQSNTPNVIGQLAIDVSANQEKVIEGAGFPLEDFQSKFGFTIETGYNFSGRNFYKLAFGEKNGNWIEILLTYYSDSKFYRGEQEKAAGFYKENKDPEMLKHFGYFDQILSTFKFTTSTSESAWQVIRSFDFKGYLSEEYAACRESDQVPVFINSIQYHDLTGDGNEEAIVRASSCYTGTAGPDINRVYTVKDSIVKLSVNDNNGVFQGRNFYSELAEGDRGIAFTVENDALVEVIYVDTKGAKVEGKILLKIFYKWNGKEFFIAKVE